MSSVAQSQKQSKRSFIDRLFHWTRTRIRDDANELEKFVADQMEMAITNGAMTGLSRVFGEGPTIDLLDDEYGELALEKPKKRTAKKA